MSENIRASIDIGSNSTLLLVVNWSDGKLIELENESRITSLGKGIDQTGLLAAESIQATKAALAEYLELIKKHELDPLDVQVTATEASRVASNSMPFFEDIEKKFGFRVQLIDSDREAYLAALGVSLGLKHKPSEFYVLDIGGASSEVTKVKSDPFEVLETVSFPFGSVRVTDWIHSGHVDQKLEDIKINFKKQIKSLQTMHLIAAAGTMTSFAAIHVGLKEYEDNRVNGLKLDKNLLNNTIIDLNKLSVDEIRKQYPFLGKRAPFIKGGCLTAQSILNWLGVETFEVSTYGLRYGSIV
jgi:exopolyphosphatase/guanosine-5'-triphosphate,3'-diphosphate pyrophosphatase